MDAKSFRGEGAKAERISVDGNGKVVREDGEMSNRMRFLRWVSDVMPCFRMVWSER